jgi:hypothetical protein
MNCGTDSGVASDRRVAWASISSERISAGAKCYSRGLRHFSWGVLAVGGPFALLGAYFAKEIRSFAICS